MSRYVEFSERATTQVEMLRALRACEHTGGGHVLLEGGGFRIDRDTRPRGIPSEVTIHLGDGASLEVRDGLAPSVCLTLPEGYVQSLTERETSPRSLRWSSSTPPLGLMSPSQNPHGYGDVTLYVPESLWDTYLGGLRAWGPDYPPRYALERWVGYDLEPPARPDIRDYLRESREARQGGTTYTLDEVEAVHAPRHYTWLGNALAALGLSDVGNVEAWDVLDAAFPSNPHLWNVGKYLLRQGRKGGEEKRLEDLRKARQYLDRAIEDLERG